MIAFIGIYRREFARLLASSGVTVLLPLGLAWLAWQHYHGNVLLAVLDPLDTALHLVAVLDPLDTALHLVAVVLAPLAVWVTAPSLSVERQTATATLWSISPVGAHTVLFGKFLAICTVLTGALFLLLLAALGIDTEIASVLRFVCGLFGLLLLVLPVVASTLLASALVQHFSTAFAWGMALLCGWAWGGDVLLAGLESLADLVPALSVLSPLSALANWDVQSVIFPLFLGWLDLGAAVVLLVATLLLLLVTHQVVGAERWRG